MSIKISARGALLVIAVLLVGCAVSFQRAEGGIGPTGSLGMAPGGKPVILNRLSGGDERVDGSGWIVTENYDLRDFGRVEVSHAFRVDVVQGSGYEVVVRVDDNLQPHLQVEKRGDTLVIGLKPLRNYNLGQATMEAEVRMPELRGLEVSGAGDVRISGFSSTEDLDVRMSGASYLEGEISARDVKIEASGASRIRLRGKAEGLRLDISGASDLDLGDFPAGDADIELSGASEAEVKLSGTLDIDASGASRLTVAGNPTMGRIDLSGASSVERR